MKTFKILCIPPYDGMRRILENIAEQRSDIEFTICPGEHTNVPEILDSHKRGF